MRKAGHEASKLTPVTGAMDHGVDHPWIAQKEGHTMRLQMLARTDCTGGTCPAVYDGLDGRGDQLVVQGKQADHGLIDQLTGVAADENAVLIERDTVARALTPKPRLLSTAEFQEQFSAFSYTAFRLETLQRYIGTGRDEDWISLVKDNAKRGKRHSRVHVVAEPLTASMTEELTIGYPGSVAAGEKIGIIPIPDPADWPTGVANSDFWLFDSSTLVAMHYDPDGTWTGAELITDPKRVVEACRVRDAAWRYATDWDEYISARRELHRRLA